MNSSWKPFLKHNVLGSKSEMYAATQPDSVLAFYFLFFLVGCFKGLFLEAMQRLGTSSVVNCIYCSVV